MSLIHAEHVTMGDTRERAHELVRGPAPAYHIPESHSERTTQHRSEALTATPLGELRGDREWTRRSDTVRLTEVLTDNKRESKRPARGRGAEIHVLAQASTVPLPE